MNFGRFIKDEIINKPIKELHCKKAFLAGVLRGSGSLFYKEDKLGLLIKVSSEKTAMLVTSLLEILYNYEVREITVSEDRLNKNDRFCLVIDGENAQEILDDLEVIKIIDSELSVNFNFAGKIIEKDCCFHAFLRGLFVSSGSCTIPSNNDSAKTGYHLEIPFSHSVTASLISGKLFSYKITTKILRRKDNYVLYIKSADDIKDFLAFLPAPVSVLKLTDIMIERELYNDSNRRKNCDLGNVGRQIEAEAKQIEAINKIINSRGLESLKPDLRETANARINNPDDSLIELANVLGITKSCLNHRLRKIISISNEI